MNSNFNRTLAALRNQESNHWTIGDALGQEISGSHQWDQLMDTLRLNGLDYKESTLKAYRRVSNAFGPQDRKDGVSFAAHQAALTAGGAKIGAQMITNAINNAGSATRDNVLAEVRKIKGRTTGQTSDAVAAWRSLRAGVEKLLALPEGELDALLLMDGAKSQAEAAKISKQITLVNLAISDSLKRVGTAVKAAKKARAAQTPKPTVTKKATPAAKPAAGRPNVKKMGAGRGE